MVDYRLNPTFNHNVIRPVQPSTGASGKAGGGGGGGGGVTAVHLDGSNDYLTVTGGLTGDAHTKLISGSLWFRDANIAASQQWIYVTGGSAGGTTRLIIYITGSKFLILAYRAGGGGAQVLGLVTVAGAISNDTWHHVLFGADMTDTDKRYLRIDDVDKLDSGTHENFDMEIGQDYHSVGARGEGALKYSGDLAEFWFNPRVYNEDTESYRRKFIDASGKPVDLGANGETPTGSSPAVYFGNELDTWHTNLGAGGGFIEVGALTAASSSPSD